MMMITLNYSLYVDQAMVRAGNNKLVPKIKEAKRQKEKKKKRVCQGQGCAPHSTQIVRFLIALSVCGQRRG